MKPLLAIVAARLYDQRRFIAFACVAALAVGLLAPEGAVGPVVFCSLLGIAIALAQIPGRAEHLDRCEQSAPLFGRELARAKALAPCIGAAFAAVIYAAASLGRGSHDALLILVVTLGAVTCGTLVALSATIRRSWARALYILLAAAASAIAYVLAIVAHQIIAEVAFCALVAFAAIRQYGESLARYDPI
jgi:hypothetical protein